MRGLLEAGVAIAPGPYEVLFPSMAHTEADLDSTVSAFAGVAGRVAQGA
jgi:glutamate-1-semialdehyde 2,1-aminomutase